MSRLPPAEKLPLAVRKNIRDEFEAKKPEIEQRLSSLMGEPWTINVNPYAISPYGKDGWAKDSLGSCIASYLNDAVGQLAYFKDRNGDEVIPEINGICGKHELSMDVDETKSVSYCGCAVQNGVLVILFHPDYLGTNTNHALESSTLLTALNKAPPAEGETSKISFAARTGIRLEYDTKISATQAEIAKRLNKPDIRLSPNFDENFAKLAESQRNGNALSDDWEFRLGYYTHAYFESVASTLQYEKFEGDDMLQEGFHEAIPSGEIVVRIVEKLQNDSYCEAVVEDGVLYVQCTATQWGVNTHNAAQRLMDHL